MNTLLQDIRYGLRMLAKAPGFAAVAILTLALGIGATTAIFSVVNAALLRSFLYNDPAALVIVQERIPKVSPEPMMVSAPDIGLMADENRVFEGVAAFGYERLNLSGAGDPERIAAARISANLFPVLGARPLLGRTFRTEQDQPGHLVTILSYDLWQRRFGGDRNVVGRWVTLDGQAYTIIGVMSQSFEFPPRGMPQYAPADLWVPVAFTHEELADIGDNFDWGVLARLKPGVTLGQAQSNMDLVAGEIQKTYGPVALSMGVKLEAVVTPFRQIVVSQVQKLLLLLLGAVGLLLLIACANVVGLLLWRAATRQREIALRVALGAQRGRVVRQLLTESILLGLLGGCLGVLAAAWGTQLLVATAPATIPQVNGIGVDRSVLLFAALVSIAMGLLFGLAPALAAARTDLNATLKEGGRLAGMGHGSLFARSAFVVAQVAIAFVLIIGAGLLIRSFVRAENADAGVRAENVVTATIAFPPARYTEASRVTGFFQQLIQRMGSAPNIEALGAATDLPTEMDWDHIFSVEEHPTPATAELPDAAHALVLGDYFQALGVPLIRGRFFTAEEEKGKSNVVMISAGMARRYWPGEDPIGKRLKWGPSQSHSPWLTVVGVVGDVHQDALDKPIKAHTYEPYFQACSDRAAMQFSLCTTLNTAVRAKASSAAAISELRAAVRAIDPAEPLTRVRTMQRVLETSIAPRRFNTFLLIVFASAALFLSALGLYGALAFRVAQRTHEIGIRVALGAERRDVMRLVVGQGLKLASWGAGIGLLASLALTRLMSSLLYGVSASDPLTFAGVAILLMIVALAACYIPARRAMRVDPMVALRYE